MRDEMKTKTHIPIPPSSLIPHPSSLILPPSSLILHPSSFIRHPSSLILHPSSLIPHPFLLGTGFAPIAVVSLLSHISQGVASWRAERRRNQPTATKTPSPANRGLTRSA